MSKVKYIRTEKDKVRDRKYYLENREKRLAYLHEWRLQNKEWMREYQKKWRSKKGTGFTFAEYNEAFLAQGGCCAICNIHVSVLTSKLHADHDHRTGQPRQLLCRMCNTGLGMFRDNPERMRFAAAYVERFSASAGEHAQGATVNG